MITIEKLTQKLTYDLKITPVSQCIETPKKKQYYSVKEAAECIMVFDGSNVHAKSFIRACENARDLIDPVDIPFLSRVIRSRIRGEADIHLYYVDADFDNIMYEIKRLYLPRQIQWKWQNELAFVKQEPYETPLQYGKRIKNIVNYAKEKIRENNRPEIAIDIIKSLEDTALNSFVVGLENKELENKVNYTNPKSLKEAIESAKIMWDYIKNKRVSFAMKTSPNFDDDNRYYEKSGRIYYDYPYYEKSGRIYYDYPNYEKSERIYYDYSNYEKSERIYYDYPYRKSQDLEYFISAQETNKPQYYTDANTYNDRQQQFQNKSKTNDIEYEDPQYNPSNNYYTPRQNDRVVPDIFCEYCKHTDHMIEECRAFEKKIKYLKKCDARRHNINECRTIENPTSFIQSDDYPTIRERVYTFYHHGQAIDEYRTLTMTIKNSVNTTEISVNTVVNESKNDNL